MGPFESSLGAIVFWFVIGAISIIGTLMPYLKHRETQRTIRAAIDKGQPVDPALLAEPPKKEKPETFILIGVVLIAAAVGMQALGVAVSLQAEMTIYPIFGVGVMIGLIGLALLGFGGWRMKARARTDER